MSQPVRTVTDVSLGEETETDRGWSWAALVRWEDGAESRVRVELSWADHDHWSGGAWSPSDVAARVVKASLPAWPVGRLPDTVDAATLARRLAHVTGEPNAVRAMFRSGAASPPTAGS